MRRWIYRPVANPARNLQGSKHNIPAIEAKKTPQANSKTTQPSYRHYEQPAGEIAKKASDYALHEEQGNKTQYQSRQRAQQD